jgi:hypothetical protein
MNKETLEEAAENHLQKWRLLNNIHLSNILHAERCKNDFINGAKWQQERMLAFINDEDNHTEGELGNSCIDVQTLVNFIKQK